MSIEIISGDITSYIGGKNGINFIAHQCNCVSEYVSGVAKAIFDLAPSCDVKHHRKTIEEDFGKVQFYFNDNKSFGIFNMMSQIYPGLANTSDDSVEKRAEAFESCLKQIGLRIKNIGFNQKMIIAFPYNIGCGLAGGDWPTYSKMIKEFDKKFDFLFDTKLIKFDQ